jgi:hypothetical protein
MRLKQSRELRAIKLERDPHGADPRQPSAGDVVTATR